MYGVTRFPYYGNEHLGLKCSSAWASNDLIAINPFKNAINPLQLTPPSICMYWPIFYSSLAECNHIILKDTCKIPYKGVLRSNNRISTLSLVNAPTMTKCDPKKNHPLTFINVTEMPEMPESTDSNKIGRLGPYVRSRDFNVLE